MRQAEYTDRWFEELESGKHKQTQGSLVLRVGADVRAYCCLGLAAEIMGELNESGHVHGSCVSCEPGSGCDIETSAGNLLREQLDKLGIVDADEQSAFVHMNDTLHFSFAEIAAVGRHSIEHNQRVDFIVDALQAYKAGLR